jgi:hypothetical protein
MILLDEQMRQWSGKLNRDVGISPADCDHLASTIAREVASLPHDAKVKANNTLVPLSARLEELRAFQGWMDFVSGSKPHPAVVRAQVITELYVCFVYLGEACFKVLRKESPSGTATRRCCRFLTENPVRALRNAVSHPNWQYLPDFSGLQYWARKGDDSAEPLTGFVVLQEDLAFW